MSALLRRPAWKLAFVDEVSALFYFGPRRPSSALGRNDRAAEAIAWADARYPSIRWGFEEREGTLPGTEVPWTLARAEPREDSA